MITAGFGWLRLGSGLGFKERDKVVEGKGGIVGTIKWVGIEVEDGFSSGRRSGGDDRFRKAGADND